MLHLICIQSHPLLSDLDTFVTYFAFCRLETFNKH